jgi:hypothetical protein
MAGESAKEEDTIQMKNVTLVLAAFAGLLLTSSSALAGNVKWTITPTSDLSGSFVYDADTDTFSSITIPDYVFTDSSSSSFLNVFTATSALGQTFIPGLTNSGGTVLDLYIFGSGYELTTVVGVPETVAGTPEPGSILLGGSGALAFALLRMRRRQAK